MRVLYFHQHFSTRGGATGTRSYEMARALVGRGHEVVMVCGTYDRSDTGLDGPFTRDVRRGVVDGIEVVELRIPYSNRSGFASRAWRFIVFAMQGVRVALREPCDVVFATSTPLTAGIPGIVARWIRRKPFVFEVRDLWPELPREMGVITNPVILKAMDVLEWISYRSAERVVGLAPGIAEGIARRGVTRERIAVIPNGCDLDVFEERGETRRPEGIAESDLMAVFAGTHGIANGLDAVLDAAGELERRGRKDIKLVFVGDGALKADLQARAAREGLDRCVFLAPVPKLELAALLRATDVGLMILANVPAFYYGTSPNKFFDYIAAGVPVLINYPGWVAELIEENACGVAVPPADPVAFANALEDLADRPDERRSMRARARRLAAQAFDRRSLAAQLIEVLEAVVEVEPRTRQVEARG